MRAAVCHAYGPPETIRVGEVPSPALAPGQVRVRVGAAAVNFPDVLLMANTYQLTVPVPFVPGSEFAGVIAEVGVDVVGVDAVIDPVGGELAEPALRALRWGGRFVTVGYASGTVPRIPLNLVLLKGCQILGFQFRDFAAHAPDELARNEAELLELLGDGRALPHVGATFTLVEAAAALRHVAEGKAIGKVVLAMGTGESPRVRSAPCTHDLARTNASRLSTRDRNDRVSRLRRS
jgi:NADPH:quinone reductase-like Zn-dependent oxidoreductase